MIKLGKLTDYGTMLATVLATEPGRLLSALELAQKSHVSEPTVRKLLKQLTRAGLVESLRGAHGGYRLARAPSAVTVADVVAALEGPIALTQCATHGGGCSIEPHCGVRGNWNLINTALKNALSAVTLEQMASPMRAPARPMVAPLVFTPSPAAN